MTTMTGAEIADALDRGDKVTIARESGVTVDALSHAEVLGGLFANPHDWFRHGAIGTTPFTVQPDPQVEVEAPGEWNATAPWVSRRSRRGPTGWRVGVYRNHHFIGHAQFASESHAAAFHAFVNDAEVWPEGVRFLKFPGHPQRTESPLASLDPQYARELAEDEAARHPMPDADTLPQVEMPADGSLILTNLPDGGLVVRQHGSMQAATDPMTRPDEFRACLMPGCRCEDYMPAPSPSTSGDAK
jgi:hypothetical protein